MNLICIIRKNRHYYQQLTKHLLQSAFFDLETVVMIDSSGNCHQGKIATIQMEDGSGRSFNITTQGNQKFHIRTID